tara:strand:- start:1149 stop:1718 length:570 start_codon:yes stop_codon:yes gene_type:complete
MSLDFEECPFWDFSIDLYGRKGVSAACIALQDRHKLDVNIILLSMWMGHSGRAVINHDTLINALDVSTRWNKDIICGIRAVRLSLKDNFFPIPIGDSEQLRKNLLALEIDGEHLEQLAIASTITSEPNSELDETLRLAICTANLGLYFTHLDAKLIEEDYSNVRDIISATFDGINEENVNLAMQSFAAI